MSKGYLSEATQEICLLWTQNYFTDLTRALAWHVTSVHYWNFTRATWIKSTPSYYIRIFLHLVYINIHTVWWKLQIVAFLLRLSRDFFKAYVASVMYGWMSMRRRWKGADWRKLERSDTYLSPCGFVHHMCWPGKEPRPPQWNKSCQTNRISPVSSYLTWNSVRIGLVLTIQANRTIN